MSASDARTTADADAAQPRWLGVGDVLDLIVDVCLEEDKTLIALSRVCWALRVRALPTAFRDLVLDCSATTSVREAQVEQEPALLGLVRRLVVSGDCPSAGRWVERCRNLTDLDIRYPLRSTLKSLYRGLRFRPVPTGLHLAIASASSRQAKALEWILDRIGPGIQRLSVDISGARVGLHFPRMSACRSVSWTCDGEFGRFNDFIFGIDDSYGDYGVLALERLHLNCVDPKMFAILPRAPLFDEDGAIPKRGAAVALASLVDLRLDNMAYSSASLQALVRLCVALRRLDVRMSRNVLYHPFAMPHPSAYPASLRQLRVDMPMLWADVQLQASLLLRRRLGTAAPPAPMPHLVRLSIAREPSWPADADAELAVLQARAARAGLVIRTIE